MSGEDLPISLQDVQDAAKAISSLTHLTPVQTCSAIDSLLADGQTLHFKCENLQKTGAFKYRGASNAIRHLSAEERKRGVVTHSSGNHAAALALAAAKQGVTAHIVCPDSTPKCKVAAVKEYLQGTRGQLAFSAVDMASREAKCQAIQAKTGAVFIPPYNHAHIMAGQGTLGLELMQQTQGSLDAVIVPISGGGMLAGVATAVKGLKPDILVLAAEPRGRNDKADAQASLRAGKLVPMEGPDTIADGLRGRFGDLTWAVARALVDDVIAVSEEEIVAAMQLCFERMKMVVEPSGAVGLAAALTEEFQQLAARRGLKKIGVILSGGNVDLAEAGLWRNLKGQQ